VTYYERLSLIAASAAVFVSVATFVAFMWQIRIALRQVAQAAESTKRDHERRRKQATLDFYATTLEKRSQLRSILPYDRNVVGVRDLLSTATDEDSDAGHAITDYLSLFESLGAGVATDVYSFPVVDAVAGGRVLAIAENYGPWIRNRRQHFGTPKLYEHLEALADRIANHRHITIRRGPTV
jgi:hypothetical protein